MTKRKIEYWVIPPDQDAEFVADMENVLETYAEAYDPQHPVLCMDEQPVQLLKERDELGLPLPLSGHPVDLTGPRVERREQVQGAAPPVLVFDAHRSLGPGGQGRRLAGPRLQAGRDRPDRRMSPCHRRSRGTPGSRCTEPEGRAGTLQQPAVRILRSWTR